MFKVIISLLRSISNALDEIEFNDHVGITEYRAKELILHSEASIKGANPNDATLTSINNNIQDLMQNLYNDGAGDTPKGDIVKIQDDLNSRDYIIEEQVGSTGYRKWASGMLEQWGITTSVGSFSAYTSATLPIAFKDTDYCVVGSIRELMNGFMFIMPHSELIIKFRVSSSNGTAIDAKISWKAEGYWK